MVVAGVSHSSQGPSSNVRAKRKQSLGRAAAALVGILSLLSGLMFAAARADSPDPKLPFTGSSVVNADGSVTLTVQGDWAWTTHHSDCNSNRYAVGWAVDWNDSSQPGNVVGQANGNGPVVDVGTAAANALNPADNAVHYAPSAPRCGTYDPVAGYNSGTWGPLSHTYPKGVPTIVPCVVTYDVHKATGSEVVAGGQNHNHDNSVQSNQNTPLGNGCFPFTFPVLTTNASATVTLGNAIHDTAHLTGATNDAGGFISFTAYGPGDNTCTNKVFTSTAVAVNGSGDYPSQSFTPATSGTYRWIAHYTGDAKNSQSTTACADPAESVAVTAPNPAIEVVKDGPAQAHEGDVITYSFKVTNTGDVTLNNISVDDNVIGPIGTIASLAVGASQTLTKAFQVPVGKTDIVNTVTACGTDALATQVCDTDNHKLHPIHPAIHVVKDGPALAHVGDTITYTFATTNPGDVPLANVTLDDARCDGNAQFLGGDTNGDAMLQTTETWTYSCLHLITAGDPDPLPNTATATGMDPLKKVVTDTDDHIVDLIHPAVDVVKSGPAQAHEGDTVTYSFKVTNTGDTLLTNVTVDDDVVGHVGTVASLAVGASTTLTKDFVVPVGNADITNTVTVCAADPLKALTCDTDHHKLHPIHPAINLTKDGPALAHVGDTVTYKFVVTNPGDVPLTNVSLTDPKCNAAPVLGSKTGGNNDDVLDLTETWSYTCTHVVTAGDPDPLPNTATVTGVDPLQKTVSAKASHLVDLIHPDITVQKSGALQAHPGDNVTYTFKVSNSGDTDLNNVSVDDNILGHIGTIASLPTGTSQTLTKGYPVPPGGGDITNTVTACGKDVLLLQVCDTDNHTLHRLNPAIMVIKSGPGTAHPGDIITYSFKVTNTGDTDLSNVTVDDDVLGHIATLPSLAVGASVTLTKDFKVPAGNTDITNTVTACGLDKLVLQVCDTDHHKLHPLDPAIHVVKNGPAQAHVGDTITYTFAVTNPGSVGLSNVTLTDPRCDSAPLLGVKSGGNTDSTLDLTESWAYSCTHKITASDPDPLPNTATASGVDPLQKTVTATANHTVDIIHPAVTVVKSGPSQAHEGDTVLYTFKVTNTGDTDLSNVSVDDDILGHVGIIGSLAIGTSQTLAHSFTIPANSKNDIVNTVTVCATDALLAKTCDTDNHKLHPLHPAIAIVKTANPLSVNPGQSVTYTYKVTNTGDVDLTNVTVDDDILGHIGTLPSLAVGATQTLTKAVTIQADSPTRNVATAVGTDPLGTKVSAQDDAVITVVLGEIIQRPLPRTGLALGLMAFAALALISVGGVLIKLRRRIETEAN